MLVERLSNLTAVRGRQERGWEARLRRSGFVVFTIYALLFGGALGITSADWATSGEYPFGAVRVGPWTIWPRSGSRDADPYTRAVVARSGDIPLGVGEGLMLRATVDNDGRALDARCTYRIGSVTPQARHWTLTLYGGDGRPIATPLGRTGFSSSEVLRDDAGAFTIIASREARHGNWVMMPEAGRLVIVLRLYDSPVAAGSAALDQRSVPGIERVECAP